MVKPIKKQVGRPKGRTGKSVLVYLDDTTVKLAKTHGAGNLSAGIRNAIKKASQVA